MIIGIDASRANRNHKSGTEWYSFYLIKELAKLDSRNQYILYTDKPLSEELIDLTDEENPDLKIQFDKNGFQILNSPHNNFKAKILNWPFRFFWTLGRLSLEMLFNKPDVLFIPSHTLPIFHPAKTLVTIHDVGFERDKRLYLQQPIGPEDKMSKKIINALVKFITLGKYGANVMDYFTWSTIYSLKNAKKIITVSNFSKKEILDIYGKKFENLDDKIRVIHNGYNQHIYKKINGHERIDSVIRKYGIESPYIFYLGRLERKKNIPSLVEAFGLTAETFKNYKLVLTGDANYGFDEVKYMISQYQLEDRVINTGWVEEADLPYIFNGARAFIFPSLYEGFGIPMIQAMACGVPVAASNVEPIVEVVNGSALLFNPSDVNDMSDAIAKIISDENLRNRLISTGFSRSDDFSWQKSAAQTLEQIEAL